MAVSSGQVTLNASTPTKVCTLGQQGAIVIAGTASVVFIGGPNVTATSGVNQGILVSNTTPLAVPGGQKHSSPLVPAGSDDNPDLYAIATTGTPTITFITTS